MKYLIVVLLAVVAVAAADDSSEEVDTLLAKIRHTAVKDYIKKSGYTRGVTSEIDKRCPGATGNLTIAIVEAMECKENLGNALTVCNGIRENVLTCATPIIKTVEKCLPDESKGLPEFIVKSAISGLTKACSMTGEELFEFANDCLYNPINGTMSNELQQCSKEVESKVQSIGKKIPTPKEICSVINILRPCFKIFVSDNCGAELTRRSLKTAFDALADPCNAINELA